MSQPEKKEKLKDDFNILEHTLIPNHRKMSEEEVKELLEKLNISELQLPTIPSTDPVAKKHKLLPGDFIEITRTGVTKKYPYYRRVI